MSNSPSRWHLATLPDSPRFRDAEMGLAGLQTSPDQPGFGPGTPAITGRGHAAPACGHAPPPVPHLSDLQVNSRSPEPAINGVPMSLQGSTSLRLTTPATCGGRHASRLLLGVLTPRAQVSPWCSTPSWAARTGPWHGRSAGGLGRGRAGPLITLKWRCWVTRGPRETEDSGQVVLEVPGTDGRTLPGTDGRTRVCLSPSFAGGLLCGLSKLLVTVIRESRNRVPHRRADSTLANSGDGAGRPGRGQRSSAHTAALGLFLPLLRETWK